MHTLLIHQAFVSPAEAGGTRHYEFARHCLAGGHRLTIVASDLSYLTGRRIGGVRGFVTEQEIDGLRVLRAYTHPALHRSFLWRAVSYLTFMLSSVWAGLRAGRMDVVMGTSPPIFQAVSAWVVSVVRRRPFLLEIRDLWPDFAIGLGVLRNKALIWLSRWLERFLYRHADHLIVNSPAYRDHLLQHGVGPEKVTVIPNGVDPDMFDPEAKGERVKRKWQLEGQFVVLYAGALGMANDIPTILRAAQRLRDQSDIQFLIVGDGKERPNLEQLAREWGLTHVTFAGAQPKSEMAEYLAAADVCVATLQNIPMFRTTYPNKVFDYMAAGRPTVLAIDGVIREVIEAADGGVFVPPGDDTALAEAITRLKAVPEERARMGRNARAHVTAHLNRNVQAAKFVGLLKRLAGA